MFHFHNNLFFAIIQETFFKQIFEHIIYFYWTKGTQAELNLIFQYEPYGFKLTKRMVKPFFVKP
jgi:hypothetical protein